MKHTDLTFLTKAQANDNGFAGAKRTTLLAQYRAARDSLSRMDSEVTSLLDGQNAIGGRAVLAAYAFATACMDKPAQAAKLPGWKDAAVQPGANPYCQPLKLLAGDMDKIIQSRISIWAKVFAHAHAAKIKPEHFLEHRNRNSGMRRWYDFINASGSTTAANDNKAGGGSGKATGAGGKATTNGKAPKSTPVDFVAGFKKAKRIGFVMVDLDVYMCDGDAQAQLESNSAFIGLVKSAPPKCSMFIADNDNRFV